MNAFKKRMLTRKYLVPVVGVVVGGILGYLYYYFVGCTSGHCAITGTPLGSIVVGGLIGLFITSSPCSRGQC